MGDLRPDNGSPPDDGGGHAGGLPDLPPEWGTIVIPDDASELDAEAEALRIELHQELYRDTRRSQVRRVFGLSRPATADSPSGVGVPLVIMAVAILTTLISLFVVTWDRRPGQPVPVTTVPVDDGPAGVAGSAGTPVALVDLTFIDGFGQRIRLGSVLPAAILLVDGCVCTELVLAVAGAVPIGVSVLAVGRTAPNLAGAPPTVHGLADPDDVLRSRLAGGLSRDPKAATALLVNARGLVAAAKPGVRTVEDVRADLPRLVT